MYFWRRLQRVGSLFLVRSQAKNFTLWVCGVCVWGGGGGGGYIIDQISHKMSCLFIFV